MPSIISQFKPNQQLHVSKFEETHAESLDHVSESLGCSFAPIQMLDTFPDQVAILPALVLRYCCENANVVVVQTKQVLVGCPILVRS